jgi:hypothetical protein
LTNTTDDLMTPEEVAELARVPIDTLRYWRHRKMGPPSFRSVVESATAAAPSSTGSPNRKGKGKRHDRDDNRVRARRTRHHPG